MITLDRLNRYVDQGLLSRKDKDNLSIFCYTPDAQFGKKWDDVTIQARGLIMDNVTGALKALPFKKFFNLNEMPDTTFDNLPNEQPEISEKLDGCFLSKTKLNLWSGGTIEIGKIVRDKLKPTLIGMNRDGKLVPSKVVNWHNNGTKKVWLSIEVDCNVISNSGMGSYKNIIRVTPNHSIFVNDKYVPASEIRINDIITTFEETPDEWVEHLIKKRKDAKVISVKMTPENDSHFGSGKVGFDITTETNNYFCKGILVHNSLGISYRDNDQKIMWSTKGSFDSDQAHEANRMWYEKYKHLDSEIPVNLTLLMEIICPASKIVVGYDFEDLVLLGVNDMYSFKEFSYEETVEFAKKYGLRSCGVYRRTIDSIIAEQDKDYDNTEGYVLHYSNGLRVKIKNKMYLKYHRLVSQFTNKNVWELMRNGEFETFLIDCPEEYRDEVEKLAVDIKVAHERMVEDCTKAFQSIPNYGDDKSFALHVQANHQKISGIMYSMRKGRMEAVNKIIFNMIKEELGI